MSFFLQSGSVLRIFVKVYLKTNQFQLTNILSDNPIHIGNTGTCILSIELFFVRICFQSFCVIYTIKCVQIKSYSSNSLLLVHLFSWQWLYFKQSLSIPIVLMYFFLSIWSPIFIIKRTFQNKMKFIFNISKWKQMLYPQRLCGSILDLAIINCRQKAVHDLYICITLLNTH